MNVYQSGANALYAFNLIDFQDLCRVCGNSSNNLNSLFDDHGCAYDFSSKINVYLPITVQKTDYLPQKICSTCANTLLSFHQLYTVCQNANSRFLAMLECDAGYEQQSIKQNDPSELLELQSSLSREIENEILHMNDSKDIINEIDSEIAANAAVKELERIGSTENISLVGEVIEPMEVVLEVTTTNGASESVEREMKPPSVIKSSNKAKKGGGSGNDEKTTVSSTTKGKAKKCTVNGDAKAKINNIKEKANKVKSPNGAKKSKNTEVLKENGCRRTTAATKNQVSENGIANDSEQNDVDTPPTATTSTKIKCEYCSESYTTESSMLSHIKDVHNDLIFHCEMCDDYVARAELISHMLNHAFDSNTSKDTKANDAPATVAAAASAAPIAVADAVSAGATNDDVGSAKKAAPKKITKRTNKTAPNNDSSSKENHLPKSKRSTYCAECDKTFADYGGLRYHIDHFHKKIKNYECDICGTFFSCKRIITNHIRGVHLKNVEKMFQCALCLKKFSTDSALYIHKQSHETVYKFTCHVCERKFRSQCKLKIHMTMHTKEINYYCSECNRGFAVRNNLTKHMLTHSKSFDFKCDKCNYMANQKRYLFQHIKRNHKE